MIAQETIATNHFPFEPVICIAQSPSGEIYYGGYHIYKLSSVNTRYRNTRIYFQWRSSLRHQILILKGFKNHLTASSLAVNIQTRTNIDNNGRSSSRLPSLQMNIPNTFIHKISSVTAIINNGGKQSSTKPVDFTITNSSSTYNTISIYLRSGINYSELLINGIPAMKIVSTAVNTNNVYNTSSVSIVQHASDSSTQEPYSPSPLSVAMNTTVKWTNDDLVPHTVTEGQAAASSSSTSTTDKNRFDSRDSWAGSNIQAYF